MPTPGVLAAASDNGEPDGVTWDDIEGAWRWPDGTIYNGSGNYLATGAQAAWDNFSGTAGLTEDQKQLLGALQGAPVLSESSGTRDANGMLQIDPLKVAALKARALKDPQVLAALSGDAQKAASATYNAAIQAEDALTKAADDRYSASQRNAAAAGVKAGQAYDENTYLDAADQPSATLSTLPRGAAPIIAPPILDPLSINAREAAMQPIDAGATTDVRGVSVAAASQVDVLATQSPPTISDAGRVVQASADVSDIDGSTGPYNGGTPGIPPYVALLAVVIIGALVLRSSK